jgi:hypothetical protein
METSLFVLEGKSATTILSKDAIISETETEPTEFFNKGLKLQLVIESEKRTSLTKDGDSVSALYNLLIC